MEQYIKQFQYSRKTTVAAVSKQQIVIIPWKYIQHVVPAAVIPKASLQLQLAVKPTHGENPRYTTPHSWVFFFN